MKRLAAAILAAIALVAIFAPVGRAACAGDALSRSPARAAHAAAGRARGRAGAPFFYPQRLTDRLEERYEEDRTQPIAVEWFAGGRLVTEPAGAPPLLLAGADGLGRDVFARAIYGARVSLGIGVAGRDRRGAAGPADWRPGRRARRLVRDRRDARGRRRRRAARHLHRRGAAVGAAAGAPCLDDHRDRDRDSRPRRHAVGGARRAVDRRRRTGVGLRRSRARRRRLAMARARRVTCCRPRAGTSSRRPRCSSPPSSSRRPR